jgi:hypothetical protein
MRWWDLKFKDIRISGFKLVKNIFSYVPPSENEFTATKDLIIIVFEDDIHQLEIS